MGISRRHRHRVVVPRRLAVPLVVLLVALVGCSQDGRGGEADQVGTSVAAEDASDDEESRETSTSVEVVQSSRDGTGDQAAEGSEPGDQPEVETPVAAPATNPPESDSELTDRVPAVKVRAGETELTLQPWTFCWSEVGCYDGAPPEVLPDIGNPVEILVEFPASGWEFSATFQAAGEECGRRHHARLEPTGDTTHRLVPIGFADDYDVTLFGGDPGFGDVVVSFRWETPADGALPVPAATMSVLGTLDGEVRGSRVWLWVRDLAATPAEVIGELTVTSAEGSSRTLMLDREDFDCSEGSIHLSAPTRESRLVAGLGSPPFRYEVALRLDGLDHLGSAVWPDDDDPECGCVPLIFTPPLPGL